MRLRLIHILALAALTLTAAIAAAGSAVAKSGNGIEGRVLSVDRSERTFRLADKQRGTYTVVVTSTTRFERVSFSTLRSGHKVEVKIRRSAGRWVATKVEPWSGSSRSSSSSSPSSSSSSSSSSSADDHGGRGRGSDDPVPHS